MTTPEPDYRALFIGAIVASEHSAFQIKQAELEAQQHLTIVSSVHEATGTQVFRVVPSKQIHEIANESAVRSSLGTHA